MSIHSRLGNRRVEIFPDNYHRCIVWFRSKCTRTCLISFHRIHLVPFMIISVFTSLWRVLFLDLFLPLREGGPKRIQGTLTLSVDIDNCERPLSGFDTRFSDSSLQSPWLCFQTYVLFWTYPCSSIVFQINFTLKVAYTLSPRYKIWTHHA